MKKFLLALTFILTLSFAGSAFTAPNNAAALSGSDFNPARIIDDSIFYNSNSMSAAQIQEFLNAKVPTCDTNGTGIAREWGSSLTRAQYAASRGWSQPPYTCLKDFSQNTPQMEAASGLCSAIPAGTRSAANIILTVSQACSINPQVLIVLLEKEQSLITDIWPLERQYQNATGFACPDTAPCNPEYNGFFYQVYHAARQFNVYKAFPNNYNYSAERSNRIYWQTNLGNYINPSGNVNDSARINGNHSSCGYQNVYIENQATAALYIYTPYQPNQAALNNLSGSGDACSAYGNRNFWRLFNDWFGSSVETFRKSNVFISDGVYSLNLSSGKSLDVTGASTANGTPAEIWTTTNGSSQQWQIVNTKDGFYSIKNVASGRYLDANRSGTTNGTSTQIWNNNSGGCSQKWSIVYSGSSTASSILSACSGKALDVTGGAIGTNSAKVQLWSLTGGAAQQWSFKEQLATIPDGTYTLGVSSGKVLDVTGGSSENGTTTEIWDNTNGTSQKWQVLSSKDGYYTLKHTQSGRYLDVNQAGTANGTTVQIWNGGSTGCSQKWAVIPSGSHYSLLSACSGKAIDVTGGTITTNGTKIKLWDANYGSSQNWNFSGIHATVATDKTYQFVSAASGKYLDVTGGRTTSGTSVQIWDGDVSNRAQMWKLITATDGAYVLQNVASGKYLDVTGGRTTSGTSVQIWDGDVSNRAQMWKLIQTSN